MMAMDTPARLVDSLRMATRITFRVNGGGRPGGKTAGRQSPAGHFDPALVGALEGVQRVETVGEQVSVYGMGPQLLGAVVNTLESEQIDFRNLRSEEADLEDVFLALTGREIER